MKKIINLTLGALLCASVSTAFAADKGFYVEGNVGTNVATASGEVGTGGFAFNANAGYKFNQYIAAEGGYILHAADDLSLHAIHAAARATAPLGEKAFVFGKLGVSTAFLDRYSATGVFYGGGIGYTINQQADLNVQYQGMSKNGVTIGMISTGITYHIG